MIKLKEYLVEEVLNGSEIYLALRLIKIVLFGSGGQKVTLWYRLSKCLYDKKIKRLSLYLFRRLEKGYGVYISPNAVIGIGLKLPHPTGIVIGDGVVIGRNCIIYQQVTFGGARLGDAKDSNYPHIGDNVIFFAGAKIIGKISIKSNCIVGANSVVIKDVREGCTVVGIPARIIGDK
jgi:serine O-acetyltransferase